MCAEKLTDSHLNLSHGAENRKNKGKIKKNDLLRRYDPGNTPWGRREAMVRFCETGGF